MNLGLGAIALSGSDVLLLNPDAVIAPDAVEHLRAGAARRTRASPVRRPPSTGPDRTRRRRRCAGPSPRRRGRGPRRVGLGRLRPGWGYVIASVLLVRGDALVDVGGLDEGFFLYAEEADWERRATRRGWTVSYCPEATATHVGAATDPDPRGARSGSTPGSRPTSASGTGRWAGSSYQVATVLTALRRAALGRGRRASLRLALACTHAGPVRRGPARAGDLPSAPTTSPPSSRPGTAS